MDNENLSRLAAEILTAIGNAVLSVADPSYALAEVEFTAIVRDKFEVVAWQADIQIAKSLVGSHYILVAGPEANLIKLYAVHRQAAEQ